METIITDNVKRFLELQEKVNNQIDEQGQAESKLVDELEKIGDDLSYEEQDMVCSEYLKRCIPPEKSVEFEEKVSMVFNAPKSQVNL
jgi:hypothetical protein